MHSSSTRLSLCLSSISFLAGCPNGDGESCGPEGATAEITASHPEVMLTYNMLSSLSGNDCPDPAAPAGVISLSIEGRQVGGTGLITFCIPRPDLLDEGRQLGTTATMGELRVIDFLGDANGCTFTLDSTRPPMGTGTGLGVCKNGTDKAGFGLKFLATINLRRTCGGNVDMIAPTMNGTVIVTSRDNQ